VARLVAELRAEREARERAEEALKEAERKGRDLCNQNGDLLTNVVRIGSAWSLRSVLEELEWAANHLLGEFNYDGHGHERIKCAVDASREIRSSLSPAQPAPEEVCEHEYSDSARYSESGEWLCIKCGKPAKGGVA
jgi:hypothetical protein